MLLIGVCYHTHVAFSYCNSHQMAPPADNIGVCSNLLACRLV